MNTTIEKKPIGYTYADLSKKDWVSVIFKMSQEPPRKGATFLYTAPPQAQVLRDAAQAVIERWDSPNWKYAEHTTVFINKLRGALASYDKKGE